jgi:hypothetical protein
MSISVRWVFDLYCEVDNYIISDSNLTIRPTQWNKIDVLPNEKSASQSSSNESEKRGIREGMATALHQRCQGF